MASKKRLKEILKEIGKENKFWIFFHRIRIFCLDEFWYDDRYWKASPGSTLNVFNNGLAIFYDCSSLFNKISTSCKFSLKTWNSNFFFKKRKSISRLKIFKNRYYEMKAHALKMFLRCYHILKIILIFESFLNFGHKLFHAFFMHNLLRILKLKMKAKKLFFSEF